MFGRAWSNSCDFFWRTGSEKGLVLGKAIMPLQEIMALLKTEDHQNGLVSILSFY